MPAAEGISLIQYGFEAEIEDKIWQRWISVGQHMSYEEFKNALKPPKFRDEAELMADTEKIISEVNHGWKYLS